VTRAGNAYPPRITELRYRCFGILGVHVLAVTAAYDQNGAIDSARGLDQPLATRRRIAVSEGVSDAGIVFPRPCSLLRLTEVVEQTPSESLTRASRVERDGAFDEILDLL
jgi:hypothetical protein